MGLGNRVPSLRQGRDVGQWVQIRVYQWGWRMSLFEFEDGHLVPAQFGRAVANGLSPDVLDTVRAQVLEIVSRPLFPITWRDMSRVSDPSNEQPRLTALDASGQVVSVEVLDHLDSDTLIASLSRLADTASLAWSDLAGEYPGDIEGFKAGWVHFRDSMPPSPAPGPRLVMVVGSIDAQVRPALDVLASSGVEVHEMSLRQMSNGRAFLEVHAVGPRLYGHSPQVLLGRTGAIPELDGVGTVTGQLPAVARGPLDAGVQPGQRVGARGEGEPARGEFAEPTDEVADGVVGVAPFDTPAPDVQIPEVPTRGTGESGSPVTEPPADVLPDVESTGVPLPGRHAGTHADEGADSSQSSRATTIPHVPEHGQEWGQAVHAWEQAAAASASEPVPGHVGSPQAGDVELVEDVLPESFGEPDRVTALADAADAASWSSTDHRAKDPEEAPAGVPVLLRDAQAMEALGRIVGEEAPLVLRPSLEPTVAGALTTEGLVRVPAGRFTDPTEALSASGHPGLDGWEEWHLGDHLGPTLAESLGEVNAEIIREYERAAERPRHG